MTENVSKDKAPRIALIGCGAVAKAFYLPAIVGFPSLARHLVLVDINLERAKAMATEFGITSCVKDYKDIIADVDGAIIALPHHLHFQVSLDFLHAGVHVLCEKPLAETEEQARIMVQEAKQRKVSLLVNNTRRLFPSFKKVRELIRKGEIGKPLSFQIEEGSQYNWPTVSGFYFNSKQAKGGVLIDTGAHVIDLVCWWFDSRPKVIAYTDDSFGGCDAVALVNLEIGESVQGSIKLSRLSRLSNQYVIKGEDATLICEPYDWRTIHLIKKGRAIAIRSPAGQRSFIDFGGVVVNNFIKVVLGNELPLVSGQDVIDSISVLEECYRKRRRFELPWMEVC